MPATIKILLIEDDGDDVELLQEALNTNDVRFTMEVLNDGSEAIEYIKTCVECPHVIVMDYNLPKVHGKEVLKEIKATSLLKDIPLIVLTTSSSKTDMEYAYHMGADKFLIKPITMSEMKYTTSTIFEIALLQKQKN
ncbi:MAG: response regulator [Bacteroidota bacterium]